MDNGLDLSQLRSRIIRPTLLYIGLFSPAAENLVLGTALVESGLRYLAQLGGGPALGLYQMEPATHTDIWENWLRYRGELTRRVRLLQTVRETDFHDELVGNLFYATAMCRVFYRRLPDPLPGPADYAGMAALWKRRYNTHLGAGTVEKALPYFRVACAEHATDGSAP